MRRKRLMVMLLFAVALLALLVLAVCTGLPTPPTRVVGTPELPVLPQIMGAPTVQSPSGVLGEGVAWTLYNYTEPPARPTTDGLYPGREVLIGSCLGYLDEYWPTAGVENIDVDRYEDCLDDSGARSVKLPDGSTVEQPVVIEVPQGFLDPNGWGTSEDPFNEPLFPSWMQNSTYRESVYVPSEGHYYYAIKWDALTTVITQFIQTVGASLDGDERIALVRVYAGFQGETQANRACETWWPGSPPGCPDDQTAVLQAIESVSGASCSDYQTFVQTIAEAAYDAFPSHPVVLMASASPCSTGSAESFRETLFDNWHTAGKVIGYSGNAMAPDFASADVLAGNAHDGWMIYDTGATLDSWGYPVAFEYGLNPGIAATCSTDATCRQYMYWTALTAWANGADWILHHPTWNAYYSQYLWDNNDYIYNANSRAMYVFAGPEFPTWNWAANWGVSGSLEEKTKYLTPLNKEDTAQACNVSVRATAQAAATAAWAGGAVAVTPVCPEALPTPGPGSYSGLDEVVDRQALKLPGGEEMGFSLSTDWPYYGMTKTITVTLTYFDDLDAASDILMVTVPTETGTDTETIYKIASGHWQQYRYTVTALISNTISTGDGAAFVVVGAGYGDDYLHEITFDADGSGSGIVWPSMTPTPTATPVPWSTATTVPGATATPASWATPPGVPPLPQEALVLTPDAMTYLEEANPDTAHDNANYLKLTYTNGHVTEYSLAHFDLTAFTACTLTQAYLFLRIDSGEFPLTVNACRATDVFTPGVTTWNTYTPTCAGTAASLYTIGGEGWLQLAVKDIVDAMRSITNTGFIIR